MRYEIKKLAWIDSIFVPMEDTNSITVLILARAWSIYETKKNNWISHFLEHNFFKWWKKYQTPKAVAEAVDSFWWEFNAFTWDTYAWYYVKSAPEFAWKWIDVLWDMIMDAQFPQEEMEREKWVVIQEIKMYDDEPMALVGDKWQEYFYWDNSYGWTTLWPVENIKNFTRQDLLDHKSNLYTKDNLIVIIAWKILDKKSIEDQITTIFAELPEKRKIQKPEFKWNLPISHEEKFVKWTAQNHLIIAAKWFDGNDDKRYSAWLLTTILWWNMSSRLFQNIREKEWLCYYISASHHTSPHDWVFSIRAWLEKDRFDYWIEKIMWELKKISTWDITKEEFEKAIWFNIWQYQMWIESSGEMAVFAWKQYLLYWEIQTLDDILSKIKNVKIEEVVDIAKYLSEENLYKYWIE